MAFAEQLIAWYETNKRDLPWRNIRNPYFIWLSEVILQQTRVQQGLPYYLRFVETYPTVRALAAAEEKDVLRLWQGLGYYSRARNLLHTALLVVNEHQAEFPTTYKQLKKLKGIGDYTAAAIASFAFDEKVAVVDGNVFRVLARVFGVEDDISQAKSKKVFKEIAERELPNDKVAVYNQAIMEFGALYCKPVSPDCPNCIFLQTCVAAKTNRQTVLPVKNKKTIVKKRYFYYLLFEFEQKLLMHLRGEGDIWQGLYDFVLIEKNQQLLTPATEIIATAQTTQTEEIESEQATVEESHQEVANEKITEIGNEEVSNEEVSKEEIATENQPNAIANLIYPIFEQLNQQDLANFTGKLPIATPTDEKGLYLLRESPTYVHQLTHQTIYVQFWYLAVQNETLAQQLKTATQADFYTLPQVHDLPKPILIENFLKEIFGKLV